jgi:hypothetical protein
MIRSLIHLILISFLIYLWVSNPVPFVSFEDINFDSQSQKIISVGGGAFNFNKKNQKISMLIFIGFFKKVFRTGKDE